jgi:hypothetical protein
MRSIASILLVLAMLATACGSNGGQVSESGETTTTPTTTLAPTTSLSTTAAEAPTRSTLIESLPVADSAAAIGEVLVVGADRLRLVTERDDPILYAPAAVRATQVGRVAYRDDVTLDVYYPPGHDFDEPRPAVVFVNAFSTTADTLLTRPDGIPVEPLPSVDFQNSDSYAGMGTLVAASGIIGIVYGTGDDPARDLSDAMEWTIANAAELGIDPEHIGAWMWSAHTLTGLRAVMDESGSWQQDLDCAVVYYGWMPADHVRPDLPIQVVKALGDEQFFIGSIDAFMIEAESVGAPVDYLEVEGPHAFDRAPGYSAIAEETFQRTLAFLGTQFATGPA